MLYPNHLHKNMNKTEAENRGHDVYDGERGEGAMPAQLKQERRRL